MAAERAGDGYREGEGGRVSEWQPIETAPRDGRPILGFDPDYPEDRRQCVVRWAVLEREWVCAAYDAVFPEPTHWMPLPEGPCA